MSTGILPKIVVRGVHTPLTSYHIRIRGGYPFDHNDNKIFKINRIFEEASIKYKDKNIIISYIAEPLTFLTQKSLNNTYSNKLSWFNFLHSLAEKFSFPADQITLLTSNVYAKKSYNEWFKTTGHKTKLNVVDQSKHYWLSRLINADFKYQPNIVEDKHFSMFVGRPNFQRHHIVKWFLDNIISTKNENKFITTFLYGTFTPPEDWDTNKFKMLNGTVETNSTVHPPLTLPWGGNNNIFSKEFSRGLINFCIDFIEHEDFNSYEDYKTFKKNHMWWHEDMLSEKLFKCVILKRPFIRLGMPHSLKRFKEWGFKTFDGVLFDESYDDMEDFYDRLNVIMTQVDNFLRIPFDQLKEKIYSKEVQEIVNHNYKLAYEIYNDNKDEIL